MQKVLKNMINKRNLPILLLILGGGVFVAFRTLGIGNNPPTKYERILLNVGTMLEQIHYSPKAIDDKFSKEVFDKYMGDIDAEKDVLLQPDVDALNAKFGTQIDDEILGTAHVQFVPAVTEVFKKRLAETEAVYKDILSKPFEFTKDEDFDQNYDKMKFPRTEADRREAWRKRLKFLTLERYSELMDHQEANKGKNDFVTRSNEDPEKDDQARTLKINECIYEGVEGKVTDVDRVEMFVQSNVQSMDPHTDFFPPVEKRYFDEQMSGHFFGIGASLKD